MKMFKAFFWGGQRALRYMNVHLLQMELTVLQSYITLLNGNGLIPRVLMSSCTWEHTYTCRHLQDVLFISGLCTSVRHMVVKKVCQRELVVLFWQKSFLFPPWKQLCECLSDTGVSISSHLCVLNLRKERKIGCQSQVLMPYFLIND